MSEHEKYDAFIKRLEESYPRAMRNVYCGISINEGWYHIVENLVLVIRGHIKWKRESRARDLQRYRAAKKGREELIKWMSSSRDMPPSDWIIQRCDEIMEAGVDNLTITPRVHHIEIHQIKEKFGGLRFYYQGGDDAVSGMVRMAEEWADVTCETCGDRGTRRHGGWIRTLCDKHEQEYKDKMAKYRSEDDA